MSETLYTKTVNLLQKSRKALRLYKSLNYSKNDKLAELKEKQAEEWRNLNAGLLEKLSEILSSPKQTEITNELGKLKENYYSEWRAVEADLHRLQRDLISASERGDFIKSASTSSELVALKAKMQATQAAYHELEELLTGKQIVVNDQPMPEQASKLAKVIPLRSRLGS